MIFRRALFRELTISALTVFVVLLAITMTILVVRFLGEAARGAIASEAVVFFLGFNVLGYLPVLLSLTLFIAVLQTLTRSYRDSEMVVWFSSGLSIAAWVRPVMQFAAPVVVTIALLSLVLAPWAQASSQEYRRQLDSRDDVSAVTPGVFRESRQADRVYFVESLAGAADRVRNVFMQTVQHGRLGVMVADGGRTETAANGDRFMVLERGRRYEGKAGEAEYRMMEFDSYAVRIDPFEAKATELSPKAMSTLALLRNLTPGHMAELQWRIGVPLAALLLSLLAIPLSFVNPRAGRSLNLILAILVYMTYSNLMSIVQAAVAQARLHPGIGLWAVHAGMFVLLLALFYRRLRLTPLLLFRRWRLAR